MKRPPLQVPIAVVPRSMTRSVVAVAAEEGPATKLKRSMKTTVTELPESKVKIDVTVEPEALASAKRTVRGIGGASTTRL